MLNLLEPLTLKTVFVNNSENHKWIPLLVGNTEVLTKWQFNTQNSIYHFNVTLMWIPRQEKSS